jgi:putative phage-type endonuclease
MNDSKGSFLTEANQAIRSTGVGASESAALFGLNPWESILGLWRRKAGIETGGISSKEARWGNILEPVVASAYAEATGKRVSRNGKTIRHSKHNRVICTPDYKVVGEPINVQIKTSSGFKAGEWGTEWTDEIPACYLVQVQHEMAVTDLPVTHVPVLIGGNDFRIYEVLRDDEMIKQIIDAINEFWKLVETRIQPEPQSIRDLESIKPTPESTVIAVESDIAAWSELQQVNKYLKEAKDRKAGLEEALKLSIGQREVLVDASGAALATWKRVESNRIDSKALKQTQPEIYKQFVKTSATRRFNIKGL